ncbi:hypothetical protein L228DRAFT_245304 [Xylona heveae TC161]|uniref:Tr-type G domain-containing protein n=1 Tax=Xylona heveae (strain CBS 132557 / TC161) TaxID=1328760 RepID=A0A165I4Q8_XYLHT|nr:hypothetical protein L228DRAFT_245304 [Xylona heveae TC161]KZF24379.1 hypothetical protein L228DRAFT_245304 [Xylona heveae TC161]
MASIFTFDPDPPTISSPWPRSLAPTPVSFAVNEHAAPIANSGHGRPLPSPNPIELADCGITKLEPEPQEGPTEYKLHLLLRPRRLFSAYSTGSFVSGSHRSGLQQSSARNDISASPSASPHPAPSGSSRQARLQQLTTQLLWRLQQSSPYHSSSTGDLILPMLPDTSTPIGSSVRPRRLLPGLEESKGALYEIGVSDDGSFKGLTREEMEESLQTLSLMAASLGCSIEIQRMVLVGDCEWIEDDASVPPRRVTHAELLWVTEVLVKPDLFRGTGQAEPATSSSSTPRLPSLDEATPNPEEVQCLTEQVRVSLTGPTMSGKSSLLGTLSTNTADNGRGKSRLSLLKHRHEIESGVTSSVSQELIGYKTATPATSGGSAGTDIVNYASGNVSSWNDIHSASESGRLVFLSDSAGHPRYHRTTIRGLVGCAPHWTALCVAANDGDAKRTSGINLSEQDHLGRAESSLDLAEAHLSLCLKLRLPLMIIVTKLDLASKAGLKNTLGKLLSALKAAGRKPIMLAAANDQVSQSISIPLSAEHEVKKFLSPTEVEIEQKVPIVLTSVVTGAGIGTVHALLRTLPIPHPLPLAPSLTATLRSSPNVVFHVEEVYAMSKSSFRLDSNSTLSSKLILSGHLRHGDISIGDELDLGPFQLATMEQESSSSPCLGPIRQDSSPKSSTLDLSSAMEWKRARVISIRNLRLPVRSLVADQAGTLGIAFLPSPSASVKDASRSSSSNLPSLRIRRGMVLARNSPERPLQASTGIVAHFDQCDAGALTPGSTAVAYFASVRTSVRVVGIEEDVISKKNSFDDGHGHPEGVFHFGDSDADDDQDGHEHDTSSAAAARRHRISAATLEFVSSREWVEVGGPVLLVPSGGTGLYKGTEIGGRGISRLDGVVGTIADVLGP